MSITFFHDALGRLTNRADAAGTWSWTYDGQSPRVLAETTPEGRTVAYAYHADTYELASVGLDAPNTTRYDWHAGRLTNVASRAGNFGYAYKPGTDLLQTTAYPAAGITVTRAYDAADRLLSIVNAKTGPATITSFAYDLDSTGRRTKRTHADGSYASYGYDAYDQLVSASKTNSANAAADRAYRFAYEYDEVGNRLKEDRGQQELEGQFNALNQLQYRAFEGKLDVYGTLSGTNAPYSVKVNGAAAAVYDATNFLGGARLWTGSNAISVVAADAGGKQTEDVRTVTAPPTNPQAFTYDLNGNLTADGYRTYTWTEENRLATVEATSAVPAAQRRKCAFTYDAGGRRTRKIVSVWTNGTWVVSSTNTFVWDGWLMLAEVVATSVSEWTNHYVWGQDLSGGLLGAGGIGGLLAAVSPASTNLFLYDGNGNVASLLDAASGSVTARYEYDPFGRVISASGTAAAANPVRFSTKYFDPETGLGYWGYRYYHPDTGRWISRDPLGERGGLDLYVGVNNNPLAFLDMLGLCVESRMQQSPYLKISTVETLRLPPHMTNFGVWARRVDSNVNQDSKMDIHRSAANFPAVDGSHGGGSYALPWASVYGTNDPDYGKLAITNPHKSFLERFVDYVRRKLHWSPEDDKRR